MESVGEAHTDGREPSMGESLGELSGAEDPDVTARTKSAASPSQGSQVDAVDTQDAADDLDQSARRLRPDLVTLLEVHDANLPGRDDIVLGEVVD